MGVHCGPTAWHRHAPRMRFRHWRISEAVRSSTATDRPSGARAWEQEIGSSHSPWLAGDFLFVLANDNALVCLTRSDGKVRWARQLQRYENEKKKSDPVLWAGPVLGGNRLVALSSLGEALSVAPDSGE